MVLKYLYILYIYGLDKYPLTHPTPDVAKLPGSNPFNADTMYNSTSDLIRKI